MIQEPVVRSVNVGAPREIEWLGQRWLTAIWKSPVIGRIAVRGVNLAGDDQADREVHGGEDKAVYAYAEEDEAWWCVQLGRPVEGGSFGENLTVAGMELTEAIIGERWAIGSTVLEVSQPRVPCFKLGARMGDPAFPQQFAAAGRPGAYLRIIQEGELGAGDPIRIVHRPTHGLTVGDVANIYHHNHAAVARLFTAPQLAAGWHTWAEKVERGR